MSADTKIQWTDFTFNPWSGCSKVPGHPGCAFCYAEVDYSVKMRGVKWGPKGNRKRLSDAGWRAPLTWNKKAEKTGERRRVFCASLADIFEDWQGPILDHHGKELLFFGGDYSVCQVEGFIPPGWRLATMNDLRRDLFTLIDSTPWLDWLLLTKRPENVRRMLTARDAGSVAPFPGMPGPLGQPLPAKTFHRKNVWIGTSVSNQQTADAMLPELLKLRDLTPVLFVSAEPLLGPIDLRLGDSEGLPTESHPCRERHHLLDWLIIGGESGPHARQCDVAWIRSLAQQCQAADVPCFVKQLGSNFDAEIMRCPACGNVDDMDGFDVGGSDPGKMFCNACNHHAEMDLAVTDKKGGDLDEWPADLRVRQFPTVEAR